MDLMEGPKDGFYPIRTCLWLKETNKETVECWYGVEFSTKSLLDGSNSMKVLKWTVFTMGNFIDKILFAWYKSQFCSLKMKCVFMHNNVSSHVSMLIREFVEYKRFTIKKIMEWSQLNLGQMRSSGQSGQERRLYWQSSRIWKDPFLSISLEKNRIVISASFCHFRWQNSPYVFNAPCVCACMYIYVYWLFGQHFFINAYFIKQYRHVLSTYFCIYPFELPHWFYGIRRELVDETPIIN